jgi:hypothetical protein
MQSEQTLSPKGILALQKAHAMPTVSLSVLAPLSNSKIQRGLAIKSCCVAKSFLAFSRLPSIKCVIRIFNPHGPFRVTIDIIEHKWLITLISIIMYFGVVMAVRKDN